MKSRIHQLEQENQDLAVTEKFEREQYLKMRDASDNTATLAANICDDAAREAREANEMKA